MAEPDPPPPVPLPHGQPPLSSIREGAGVRVRAKGLDRRFWLDAYHHLIGLAWPRLSALFVLCFVLFNLLFAGLYAIDPGGLAVPPEGAPVPLFWRDFFFSVHTVATIGYGNVYPVSLWANVLVVVEITLGILFFALVTGIVFARFSRPTARILFSRVAVIRDLEGTPALMLRAANQRLNLIHSAQVRVSLLEDHVVGGTPIRRFHELKLLRDSNPAFILTWTVIHLIEEDSPLAGWLRAGAAPADAELVVLLTGVDESSGQPIHGRTAYLADEIRWNARFVDILSQDPDGVRTIDYARFHDTEESA